MFLKYIYLPYFYEKYLYFFYCKPQWHKIYYVIFIKLQRYSFVLKSTYYLKPYYCLGLLNWAFVYVCWNCSLQCQCRCNQTRLFDQIQDICTWSRDQERVQLIMRIPMLSPKSQLKHYINFVSLRRNTFEQRSPTVLSYSWSK